MTITRIPFNRRLMLILFVVFLIGLQMFMKLSPWFFLGTALFFLILLAYFALMIGKGQERVPPDNNYTPFVSIIIPAHNEEEVIALTVEQAMKIRYHKNGKRNYEVWVVDDRSTDSTPKVLSVLSKKYKNLNILSRPATAFPGKAAALNDCLPLTKGEVLLILDADAHFPVDLIYKSVGYLADKSVGGAQVAKRIANPETNGLCQRQADEYKIDTSVQLGKDAVGGAVEFKGNGSFIKKSALKAIGGWSKHTITEDLDLSTKMLLGGYKIRFVPETCVWEQAAPDLKSFFKQRLRWIEGSILRYLIHMPKIIKGPLHPQQRFDMAVFLLEFALPIYIFFDLITQFIWLFSIGYVRLGNLAVIVGVTTIAMAVNLFAAFLREKRYGFFQIVGRTFVTMFYMLHWFPIVIVAVFNLCFGFEARGWGKAKRISAEKVIDGG